MKKKKLLTTEGWWFVTEDAAGPDANPRGILVKAGVIVQCHEAALWTKGREWKAVAQWYRTHGYTTKRMPGIDPPF